MDVSESLDSLWFFYNLFAPKTGQIAPVTDEAIKEAEKSSKLTDQILQNLQRESPERVQQPNPCEFEVETSPEINPEIVQQPKSSKIDVKIAAEFEPAHILLPPFKGIEFKTPVEISAQIDPKIVQQPKSSKIEVKIAAEFEPEILQPPVYRMEFKTPAAAAGKLTDWRKTRRRRRRSRRKSTGELDLFSRETLVAPCIPEYWYWHRNDGNQRQDRLYEGFKVGVNALDYARLNNLARQ